MNEVFRSIPPIHPEGRRFALIFFALTAIAFLLWQPLGWIGLALTLWCLWFFRDPERVAPRGSGLVIAPADGVVCQIADVELPNELGRKAGKRARVSIFMNVFDVHVNRAPAAGKITKLVYIPGKFVNASLDKASEHNERQIVAMKTDNGTELVFVQIAGLVARRIVCYLKEGQKVAAGERFGIIRFGSRVDVYLDKGSTPMVAEGMRTVAGETILAEPMVGNRKGRGRT